MSVRYGVELVPEPAFVAWAHRTRKLICDQYGSWTAEMFMIHLTVADFFQCPDPAVEAIAAGLATLAAQSRQRIPQFPLSHNGVATFPNVIGTIFLDFQQPERPQPLHTLHHSVIDLLGQTPGVIPDLRHSGEKYWPHLTLMQAANLPPSVFEDAKEFARAVVEDSSPPASTKAWKLILVRFQSNAAGDSWDGGRWAADLRWNVLASYSL